MPAGGVDVEGIQARTGIEELGVPDRQADQLAVAVRSPVAAQEDEERRSVEVVGQPPRTAGLIEDGEVGNPGHAQLYPAWWEEVWVPHARRISSE